MRGLLLILIPSFTISLRGPGALPRSLLLRQVLLPTNLRVGNKFKKFRTAAAAGPSIRIFASMSAERGGGSEHLVSAAWLNNSFDNPSVKVLDASW